MTKPNWTPCTVALGELKPWTQNPRLSTKAQAQRLIKSFNKFGQVESIAIGPNNEVYDGHQRLSALLTIHGPSHTIDARRSDRALTDDERRELVVTLHVGAVGSWDWQVLPGFGEDKLQEWGMDGDALKTWNNDANNLKEMLNAETADSVDAEPQIDRAAELREKWQTERGQLWRIGEHRLLCGDSTKREDVERVIGGEKAILVHADPPYGMGKEKDGIENDNLYREKLDAFQIEWWSSCRSSVSDNGSAYIWGTAEDLWRLWYSKLKDSERLTFRNEIVWDKESGQGIKSGAHRMYPTASERCLFFVLGEQGFSNNADNFWDGFEPIRSYLDGERLKMKWSKPHVEKILGSVNKTQHTFSNSHFNLIQEVDYKKLQAAAGNDAFRREYDELRREYDELRREFYATRAHFDNTHAAMTDVWRFDVLRGNERPDHPTPKPTAMIERIVKTSAPDGGVVYSPFLGTGPEIVAAQNTGRVVRGNEISPAYVAVILERMATAFPGIEISRIES